MSQTSDLMSYGMSDALAARVGALTVGNFTPAGASLAAATLMGTEVARLGTAAALSARLPDFPVGEFVFVVNRSGNSQNIYPHSSTGTIEGGGAGTAQAVASAKDALFIRRSLTDWIYIALD